MNWEGCVWKILWAICRRYYSILLGLVKIKSLGNNCRCPVTDSKSGLSEYKTWFVTNTGRLQPTFINTNVSVHIWLRRPSYLSNEDIPNFLALKLSWRLFCAGGNGIPIFSHLEMSVGSTRFSCDPSTVEDKGTRLPPKVGLWLVIAAAVSYNITTQFISQIIQASFRKN
jgi:hypothetical protein